ncbi:MAG: ABC transporter permease [Firmicutes bacterium]|nr:ABC transporter permease [Bacillota bacterium]
MGYKTTTQTGKVVVGHRDTTKRRSQISLLARRFARNRLALTGLIIFIILVLGAIFADFIVDYEQDAITQNVQIRNLPPCREHIFGTDRFGRDVFARILYGARISLSVGVVTIISSLIVGSIIGAVAAYYGGHIDNILMRIMDIFLAIPHTLMAICIVAALGVGTIKMLIALSIAQVPQFARIVRSAILTVKGQEFVEAARACGTSDRRIIIRHILPNAIGPIIVQATLSVAHTIISITMLSFLGIGVQPPTPEWGSMMSDAKDQMRHYPYLVYIPGFFIALTSLSLNLIGDGLRDALDPRLKN